MQILKPNSKNKEAYNEITEQVLIKLLGWQWVSFIGRPIRGTKCYPSECRVKQFMSPEQLKSINWQQFFGWGFAMDKCGDIWMHVKKAVLEEHGWNSRSGTIYAKQDLEELGFPLPTITDWTKPVINPNWKGAE